MFETSVESHTLVPQKRSWTLDLKESRRISKKCVVSNLQAQHEFHVLFWHYNNYYAGLLFSGFNI